MPVSVFWALVTRCSTTGTPWNLSEPLPVTGNLDFFLGGPSAPSRHIFNLPPHTKKTTICNATLRLIDKGGVNFFLWSRIGKIWLSQAENSYCSSLIVHTICQC